MEASTVRPEHKFDEISLDRYLRKHLHSYPNDKNEKLTVRQYRYYIFGFKTLNSLQIESSFVYQNKLQILTV